MSLSVGRLFGIPIRFHWSWLPLFALITWSLAGLFGFELAGPLSGAGRMGRRALPPVIPGLGRTEGLLVLGAVTAALFGLSLLLHELAHSLMARRDGIRVRGITLFFFGGVAEITSQPRTPGAEFRIAAVGPLMSLALAGVFWALSEQPGLPRAVAVPGEWLARTNLALALFNVLPGFPLDGGRIFRSALWRFWGSLHRATRVASGTGQLVGYAFVAWGALALFGLFGPSDLGGLWQIFVGMFLQGAARSQGVQSLQEAALHGSTVRQALGMGDDLRYAPRVAASAGLWEALQLMEETGAAQVLVVERDGLDGSGGPVGFGGFGGLGVPGERVVGVLTRERLVAYLRMRRSSAP